LRLCHVKHLFRSHSGVHGGLAGKVCDLSHTGLGHRHATGRRGAALWCETTAFLNLKCTGLTQNLGQL
jgi:hypothetical protein